MKLVIIAAVAENNVIGAAGKLPWHIPEDLKHFRALTLGYPVIMGRKTFESIGRPLDRRKNIVITHHHEYQRDGIVVAHSLKEAIAECNGYEMAFVIGGESIFADALPIAQRLELTRIHKKVDGNVFFPPLDADQWLEKNRVDHGDFSFVTYERKKR